MSDPEKYNATEEFLKSQRCTELVEDRIGIRISVDSVPGFFYFVPKWNKSGEIIDINEFPDLFEFMKTREKNKGDTSELWYFARVNYGKESYSFSKVDADTKVDFLNDYYCFNKESR